MMFELLDNKTAVEHDTLVHTRMTPEGLELFTFCGAYTADDAIDDVVARWFSGEDVSYEQRFTIPSIVAEMIEFHRLYARKDAVVFDAKDRPMVEALRAQLVEAMKLVDTISYEAD